MAAKVGGKRRVVCGRVEGRQVRGSMVQAAGSVSCVGKVAAAGIGEGEITVRVVWCVVWQRYVAWYGRKSFHGRWGVPGVGGGSGVRPPVQERGSAGENGRW